MIIEYGDSGLKEGMVSLSKEDREFFENLSREANKKLKEDPSFDVVEFIYDKLGVPYIKKVREYNEIDDPEGQWFYDPDEINNPEGQWFYDPFDKCYRKVDSIWKF